MRILVCFFLVCVFLVSDNYADRVFFDSGVGGPAGVNSSVVSDLAALDLQVASGMASFPTALQSITGVEWSGIYEGGFAPTSDDFTINFYNIIAGEGPTELVASFDLGDEVNRIASGIGDIFEYSAQIDLDTEIFTTNFLYMSIHNNTAEDDAHWSWGALTPAGCGCATDTWVAASLGQIQGEKAWAGVADTALDFRLLSAVPEPSSCLFTTAAACTLLARRRRSW